MTCKNNISRAYEKDSLVRVVDIMGQDMPLSDAMNGKSAYACFNLVSFDNGCQCTSCNMVHDAYADVSIRQSFYGYNTSRLRALKEIGWGGKNSSVKMEAGWVDQNVSTVFRDGLVCSRCNGRNEYAGAEHLKDGKYVCYNCK